MTESTPDRREENPILKLLLEIGPLAVFFLSYGRGDKIAAMLGLEGVEPIFVATATFMAAMVVSVAASWLLTRKMPVMPLVTLAIVLVFGGLTLFLADATFIKMKPTILNVLFAAALLGGLAFGKLFLKIIFQDGFEITDTGWRILTIRWALFFIALAILNELVWRNFSEATWVNFKVWFNIPATIIFGIFQMRVVLNHPLPTQNETDDP